MTAVPPRRAARRLHVIEHRCRRTRVVGGELDRLDDPVRRRELDDDRTSATSASAEDLPPTRRRFVVGQHHPEPAARPRSKCSKRPRHALGGSQAASSSGSVNARNTSSGERGDDGGGRSRRACGAYDVAARSTTSRRGMSRRLAYPEPMATRRTTTTAPYRCTECGWTALKWVGRCGECQQWGTVVEAAEPTGINRSVAAGRSGRRPRRAPDHRDRHDATRRGARPASASSTGCSAAASCRAPRSCSVGRAGGRQVDAAARGRRAERPRRAARAVRERRGVDRAGAAARRAHRRPARRAVHRRRDRPRDDPRSRRRGASPSC